MKQSFSLTKSNRVIVFMAALVILLVQAINPKFQLISHGFGSEMLPQFIGGTIAAILMMLLIPTFLGWIVWLARKRKPNAGSTVFNVVLVIFLFLWIVGALANINGQVQSAGEVRNLQELKNDFDRRIEQAESPEEAEKLRNEFAIAYEAQMDSLKNVTSNEGEKRIYDVMQNLASSSQASYSAWQTSFEAIQAPEIMNIAVLAEKKEFDAQRAVIDRYIERTRSHAEFLTNLEARTIEKIKQSGASEKISKNYIEGIKSSQSEQYMAMIPLLEKHAAYGESMRAVVTYIEDTQASWVFSDGQLVYSDDTLLSEFNDEVLGALSVAEAELNKATATFNGR